MRDAAWRSAGSAFVEWVLRKSNDLLRTRNASARTAYWRRDRRPASKIRFVYTAPTCCPGNESVPSGVPHAPPLDGRLVLSQPINGGYDVLRRLPTLRTPAGFVSARRHLACHLLCCLTRICRATSVS